ncbi:MAG: YncE family protein [Prevotellaceae bacterium]|jgi:DNA-binding beta-propeller fold protein YncE|nr:YncE family protein [Prevotellaceae bacterium]
MKRLYFVCIIIALSFSSPFLSCRNGDDTVIPSAGTPVGKGFYLLNEGNMGTNKASLDYYDYETEEYYKNIFPERNPHIIKDLGDVGNDLKIYGGKMYAVINCSNRIEIMDADSARHIASIDIPNCRNITFYKGYAYVSSYAGPVQTDPNARLGYVARIDTASLKIIDTCTVGYQPDEMTVRNDKLYIANSGGYRYPDYDNTVSVIDLNTFREIKKIQVAINLNRITADSYGNIYVISGGDYKNIKSNLYIIDLQDNVSAPFNIEASRMALCRDSLYVLCGMDRYRLSGNVNASYIIINTKTKSIVSRQFIDDEAKQQIIMPYGIAVNPETGEIYITDARDYVLPGRLYCFTHEGKIKREIITGDIPSVIAFRR